VICPECNGKLTVVDGVHIPDMNEYRRHKVCTQCGRDIYTTEFIVDPDERFRDEWYKHHRDRNRYKK
jgi:transcriptional regulator NrdR family protein